MPRILPDVGDKVRVTKIPPGSELSQKFLGKVGEVVRLGTYYRVAFEDGDWAYFEDSELELVPA